MSSTASDQPQAETIVLIHGMWMTPLSWEHWVNHYTDRGHRVLAPAWPGLDKEPEEKRAVNVSQQFGSVAPGIVQSSCGRE